MLTLVPLTYPVASLLTEARQLLNGSAAWDGTGDPTGAVVLLVLALALTLVPLMVGRAVARRSALPAMAALITVGAVTVGYCLQALLAI